MRLEELNREQLQQLKCDYWQEVKGNTLSYYEMATIDELVTDDELKIYYDQYDFTDEDFWCSYGK